MEIHDEGEPHHGEAEWHDPPEGVLQGGTSDDDRYFYRPGRVLISAADDRRPDVRGVMDEFGLVLLRPDEGEDPFSETELTDLAKLDINVYSIPPPGEPNGRTVPEVVDEVRARVSDEIRIYPNHVWFGATHTYFTGEDPPVVADDEEGFELPEGLSEDDVRIAVLDSGLDNGAGHPFPPWWTRTGDHAGHGTFIAGILARYVPWAQLFATDVFRYEGSITEQHHVRCFCDDARLALHLAKIAADDDLDIDIVNLSFGTPTYLDLGSYAVNAAVRAIQELRPEAAIVAAAGNWNSSRKVYPAAIDGVISVSATEPGDVLAPYSSYGEWVRARALGRRVSTYPNTPAIATGWARWAGTSFAAPAVVAAIAARMRADQVTASAAAELVLDDALPTSTPDAGVKVKPPRPGPS